MNIQPDLFMKLSRNKQIRALLRQFNYDVNENLGRVLWMELRYNLWYGEIQEQTAYVP